MRVNSNTDAISDLLTQAVGITANENIPAEGESRLALQANISHARFLLFQPQTVIANDKTLFYRADEPFIPQAIKDTLPYFLGATGDDQYERLLQVRRLRRELRLLERRHADEDAVRGQENSKATALIVEAENVGVLTPGERPAELPLAVDILRRSVNWTPARDETPSGNTALALQDDRERLLEAIRTAQREIDVALLLPPKTGLMSKRLTKRTVYCRSTFTKMAHLTDAPCVSMKLAFLCQKSRRSDQVLKTSSSPNYPPTSTVRSVCGCTGKSADRPSASTSR